LSLLLLDVSGLTAQKATMITTPIESAGRQRVLVDQGWRFMRYQDSADYGNIDEPDTLYYDKRPIVEGYNDAVVADTRAAITNQEVEAGGLKSWILPTANKFIKDPANHYKKPQGTPSPGRNFPFVQADFNDSHWQLIDLPHDWAITKDFYKGDNVPVGGGMGRLPIQGVAWYRKKINIPITDKGKVIFLDMDGAMSYAEVWLNGHLVGGWPYGYSSFRLDLTPFANPGGVNQLAIRIDNPPNSSRWYPGAGIYRDVWLVKADPIHIDQYGSYVTTSNISKKSADIRLSINIRNQSKRASEVEVLSTLYRLSPDGKIAGKSIAKFPVKRLRVVKGAVAQATTQITLKNPRLWQPLPFDGEDAHSRYEIVTNVYNEEAILIDSYTTKFGIRKIDYNPNKGLFVNDRHIRIQGVNQHHDLGALGAAFNRSAAKRQLQILKEMGCNAIRFAHNPPDPALLDLTDQMGFMVIDEINDCWQKGKTPLDFHLIFDDWYEADLRSFIRRDRNHPSIIQWSFGNEVGEQYTENQGAALANKLHDIVHQEDPSRPASASMNYAKPLMPFPKEMDVINLNYQGEGIRDAPAYAGLKGIHTAPLYDSFHHEFPDKMIVSSESASTLSTRGTYIFPVTKYSSAPASDSAGGDPVHKWVSDYGLYTAAFGASPDKVFKAQDEHPFVAGEFVWSGFDYLGEPTPYYQARSSYSGLIDLAGFKKDRYYLYQARWRPDFPMAHIVPSWTLPDRTGKITPVHVFSSGDEAELFINGKSQGKRSKTRYTYRFRWDSVVYEPGTIKVVTYKKGKIWATDVLQTAGAPAKLQLKSNTDTIYAHSKELAFITLNVLDQNGYPITDADNLITFSITGANHSAGHIVATDNGNPADLNSFSSHSRKAFSGKALCIIGAANSQTANKIIPVQIKASAQGLKEATLTIYVAP
jgi:beta-galactosidase